tara:strand:+ start:2278 stop:2655 length:378 start_codon:yes stop_codon:yes gene_type:complete
MQVNLVILIPILASVFFGLLAYLLKYWFEKLNKSQEIIISDMKILMEHKYSTTAQIEGMKESWQDMQKKLWEEMKELSESMQESYEKIVIKVDQNTMDIQNVKSENRFMALMLKDLDEKSKKNAN